MHLEQKIGDKHVDISCTNSNRSLKLNFFFSNETSLCDLLDVFLFSWCHTNTSGQQLSDTNLELSSAFAGKFEGGADKKAAKIWNAIWM